MVKKVFLDTDMGPDCDDAGALSLLNNLQKEGKAKILGITHCTSDINGLITVQAINKWYGYGDIPIGRYEEKGFLVQNDPSHYVAQVASEYLKNNLMPQYESAVKLMRRVLTENKDVILIAVGPLNNIANLLKSEPDEFSSKTGVEIVAEHVGKIYSMAGAFNSDCDTAEWNVLQDIKGAQTVARLCPVPIIYCGFEVGINVLTGCSLVNYDSLYPTRVAYEGYCSRLEKPEMHGGYLRPSWDPITVYYAVTEDNSLWKESNPSTIEFDNNGLAKVTPCGKDRFMISIQPPKTVADIIEPYYKA